MSADMNSGVVRAGESHTTPGTTSGGSAVDPQPPRAASATELDPPETRWHRFLRAFRAWPIDQTDLRT